MYNLIVHYKSALPRLIIYMFIVILVASCSPGKNEISGKDLIPENDLISILTDIQITNGLLAIPKINSKYSSLDSISTYYQVIEEHGYSKEAMNNTMKYYFIKNPKKLSQIYDQVLVILSKRESGIQKEAFIEQNRKSNLWKGKEFIVSPSITGIDSTGFVFDISKAGFYALSFTATVFPDDESLNPKPIIYSASIDTVKNENREYLKSIRYLKDGMPHYYVMTLYKEKTTDRLMKGLIFDSENSNSDVKNHFLIENISITYSPVVL